MFTTISSFHTGIDIPKNTDVTHLSKIKITLHENKLFTHLKSILSRYSQSVLHNLLYQVTFFSKAISRYIKMLVSATIRILSDFNSAYALVKFEILKIAVQV